MDEYVSAEDFLEWAKKHPLEFYEFYDTYHIMHDVEDAEQADFFGTEGFNKRFA